MRLSNSGMVAVAAAGLTAIVPAAVVSGNSGSQSTDQRASQTSKVLSPTWKTFTSSTARGTKVVVSTGGNITGFASPNQVGAVYEHIGVGAIGEGYVLCYNNGAPNYDVGESSAGFATPTTTSSAVSRNTLDGKASLVQNFSLTAGSASSPTFLMVTMTVNNRSSSALKNVVLRRQVDFDIDTGGAQGWAGFLSNHSRTKGSVSAFHDPAEAPAGKESHGIMMMLQTPGGTWETRVTNSILDTSCNPAAAPLAANYVARGDYGDTIIFNLGTIPAGGSKTTAFRYLRY